jgi:glycosyltransferase involved in cell wall biosynthesis
MIINLMLGKKRGGLEQAALDYAEALACAHIPALTVISPEAWVEAPLVAANVPHQSLANFAAWDPFAARRLRRLAAHTKTRAVICHGNRALTLALHAFRFKQASTDPRVIGSWNDRPSIIAVAHNYSTRRFARADGCFSITQHLAEHLERGGARNIQLMPNMVRITPTPERPEFRTPPVIGSMGRLVPKKGFTTFIEALAAVKSRGVDFRAVLGGDGDQRPALEELVARYELQNHVRLEGWVQDKTAFFAQIDLFVLPSKHEPFGIVLIEALARGLPVITTDAEGPREIVRPDVDAILTPRGDALAMATAIIRLMEDPRRAHALGSAGRQHVSESYSMQAMATRLQTALAPYITAS